MIKVSHGGINIIEKPMEIQGLPKIQLMFNNDENTSPPSSQVNFKIENTAILEPFFIRDSS